MLQSIISSVIADVKAHVVVIEVNIANGFPQFVLVGLPDAVVKESRERIRTAIGNSGLKFPDRRVTVNMMPTGIRKEGAHLDLAVALGIVCAFNKPSPSKMAAVGELSLTGEVVAIKGLLPMLLALKDSGYVHIMIPKANLEEALFLEGIWVYPVGHLTEALGVFAAKGTHGAVACSGAMPKLISTAVDFGAIRGQQEAKRMLELAAAGGHHVMLMGPPGCGKTLMAQALPSILPNLAYNELLELSSIHGELLRARPFRSPHYHITRSALCGGGARVKPGEVSLAHCGVLYMDEFLEFDREVLEALRSPMSTGEIALSRIYGALTLPARFTLVATFNPCPCGHFGDSSKICTCSALTLKRYRAKLSGPLLDRFDLQGVLTRVPYDLLRPFSQVFNASMDCEGDEKSSAVKERVEHARQIQGYRFKHGNHLNAFMGPTEVQRFCKISSASEALLSKAYKQQHLSARSLNQTLKVARTIADLDLKDEILEEHLMEALQYRRIEREERLWQM